MYCIDVYEQYFEGEIEAYGVTRHGALVKLTATGEEGMIKYEAFVTFFFHEDEEDYAVSYDLSGAEELYNKKGRRSKKRESELMEELRPTVDRIAEGMGGRVFWDKPLREARHG